MPRDMELQVSGAMRDALGISFKGQRLSIGKWGQADDWARLEDGTLVCLEVEENQKHPSTNVVKYWPYLEEQSEERVILIQVFFPHSPGLASSRGNLCRWYGDRIARHLEGRFERYQLVFQPEGRIEGIDSIRERLTR